MSKMIPELLAVLDPKLNEVFKKHAHSIETLDRHFEKRKPYLKLLVVMAGILCVTLILFLFLVLLQGNRTRLT